ncbi:hypothetical protein B0T11DRAFT_312230 [Plectosphaerella cucumerina]|uniref:Uncharacterized protein n=1 Tax=Plectosphaerella cucumerina TaxID=40658 RepID=A0A8K0T7S6_9PEZI|nr:hypothetical protein B0T11DRAFT_312230 [Plectosphaerella cucumerina]
MSSTHFQPKVATYKQQRADRLNAFWTTPTAYRRVRIVTDDDIEATYPFITACVENPNLALSVNEIAIDPDAWTPSWSSTGDKELSEPARPVRHDAHAAVEAYARGLGLSAATTENMIIALRWKMAHLMGYKSPSPNGFSAHNADYANTVATLLLSICKNVEVLHIGDNYLLHNSYGRLPSPSLQKLKSIRFLGKHSMFESFYSELDFLVWMRCFHRLPALKSVEMDAVMEYQQVTRDIFPPKTGSFKSLHITHADMGADMIGIMVRVPKALEEFVLSIGGLRHPDDGGPSLRFKTLGKSLFDHKDTLRVLDLDIDRQCGPLQDKEEGKPNDAHPEEECYKDEFFLIDKSESTGSLWPHLLKDSRPFGIGIGPLDQFTALTHLSISLDALLGWPPSNRYPPSEDFETPFRLVDGLPASLESLRIYGYSRGESSIHDDHVDELMEKMGECLPKLKNIEGLEETIEVVKNRTTDVEEEDLWERPHVDIDWLKA